MTKKIRSGFVKDDYTIAIAVSMSFWYLLTTFTVKGIKEMGVFFSDYKDIVLIPLKDYSIITCA